MKNLGIAFILTLSVHVFAPAAAHAQIVHVTARAPKSPGPPMALVQSNAGPAAVSAPTPRVVFVQRPVVPMDRVALEQRVVAFQKRRAQEGSASAQYQLALRLLNGTGVERNIVEARTWLAEAAKQSFAQAQRKLQELDAAKPQE
jgi:hypothetical protein